MLGEFAILYSLDLRPCVVVLEDLLATRTRLRHPIRAEGAEADAVPEALALNDVVAAREIIRRAI